MRGLHRYDGDLQMFVQGPREPDANRLRFLRWLAECGRLEHEVAGPAAGPLRVTLDASDEVARVTVSSIASTSALAA